MKRDILITIAIMYLACLGVFWGKAKLDLQSAEVNSTKVIAESKLEERGYYFLWAGVCRTTSLSGQTYSVRCADVFTDEELAEIMNSSYGRSMR